MRRTLWCGGVRWGQAGGIPGHRTRGGTTACGRAADITVTGEPHDRAAADHVEKAAPTAMGP